MILPNFKAQSRLRYGNANTSSSIKMLWFKAVTIYESLRPLYYPLKIFGLAPEPFHPTKRRYRWSERLYAIVAASGYSWAFYVNFFMQNFSYMQNSSLIVVICYVFTVFLFLIEIFTVLRSVTVWPKMQRLFRKQHEVDQSLRWPNVPIDHAGSHRRLTVTIWTVLILLTAAVMVSYRRAISKSALGFSSTRLLTYLVQSLGYALVVGLPIVVILLLKCRFRAVNDAFSLPQHGITAKVFGTVSTGIRRQASSPSRPSAVEPSRHRCVDRSKRVPSGELFPRIRSHQAVHGIDSAPANAGRVLCLPVRDDLGRSDLRLVQPGSHAAAALNPGRRQPPNPGSGLSTNVRNCRIECVYPLGAADVTGSARVLLRNVSRVHGGSRIRGVHPGHVPGGEESVLLHVHAAVAAADAVSVADPSPISGAGTSDEFNALPAMTSTVYDCFRPMEIYLKVTGLLPIFWRDRLTTTQRVLNWAWFGLNLTACVAVSFFMLKQLPSDDVNFVRRSVIRKATNYCYAIVVTTVDFAVANHMRKIFDIIHQVDCELRRVGRCFVNHQRHRTQIVLFISCYGTCCCIVSLIYFYMQPKPLAVVLCAMRYEVGLVAMCNQICIIIWLGWTRFRKLNDVLRMYFPTTPTSGGFLTTTAPGHTAETAVCSEKEQLTVLRQIKILHDKLNDVVELVNYCFSVQITFCVGLCFVIGVVCSFGLFRAFIYRNELFYMGVLNFIWYMYYLFFVLFFIAVGSKITREGKRIGVLVHKAINCSTSTAVINELNIFSQQLLHRSPVITCGLFVYDWTLLYTMIGATATYLIILIQFDVSFPNLVNVNGTATTPGV